DEIIFVQPRNEFRELWDGRRLGVEGVKQRLGFQQVYDNLSFHQYDLDFSKFDQILFFDFHNDVRDDGQDPADLFDLIQQFKVKVNYPSPGNAMVNREPAKNNLNTRDLEIIMHRLRGIKTKEEIELIRKAVQISCAGQVEVMKA